MRIAFTNTLPDIEAIYIPIACHNPVQLIRDINCIFDNHSRLSDRVIPVKAGIQCLFKMFRELDAGSGPA